MPRLVPALGRVGFGRGCRLVLLLGLAACSVPNLRLSMRSERDRMVHVTMITDEEEKLTLVARICRPDAAGPAPVVIINHAAAASAEDRADMTPLACSAPPARWFLDRGYVVIAPLRRGYGESQSEGDWAENAGACASPDYVRAGEEAAQDVVAVAAFARTLPFVKPDGMVVIGEDAGGWATIAADAAHAPAAAFINIVGGRGARSGSDARHVCRPDLLADAAAHFGSTATTPMLWLYAANDSIFSGEVVADLHAAFERAGGKVSFVQLDPIGMDGHQVFNAPTLWGPFVARYLDQLRS